MRLFPVTVIAVELLGCATPDGDSTPLDGLSSDVGLTVDSFLDTDDDSGSGGYSIGEYGPYLPPDTIAWYGDEPYDYAGASVRAGEVLPSAYGAEVVVGAPSTYIEGPDYPHGGAYLLQYTAPAGLLEEVAFAFFAPITNGDYWGEGVQIVGDITFDGQPDVTMGGTFSESPVLWGPVYSSVSPGVVEFDVAAAWYLGVESPAVSPVAVFARCGDVDGDGVDDLCVGSTPSVVSPSDVSEALVWRGPLAGSYTLDDVDIRLQAPSDELAGRTLAGADLDGDGVGELVVGAYQRSGGDGGAYVVEAASMGTSWLPDYEMFAGESGGGQAGQFVAAGGDWDGDGTDDFIVGAPQWDATRGRAYVVTSRGGGDLGLSHTIVDGSGLNEWCGFSGAIGDLDGDGADDLTIGAPENRYVPSRRGGKVVVFAGPTLSGHLDEGSAAGIWGVGDVPDGFGGQLDVADLDMDERSDLIVGAPYDSKTFTEAGAVYVIWHGGI